MQVTDVLTADEIALLRTTIGHFLAHPDYAEGDERGITFGSLEFGSPLPLEVVIRDWCAAQNGGDGGRAYKQGDCYGIYVKLYESGLVGPEHLSKLTM